MLKRSWHNKLQYTKKSNMKTDVTTQCRHSQVTSSSQMLPADLSFKQLTIILWPSIFPWLGECRWAVEAAASVFHQLVACIRSQESALFARTPEFEYNCAFIGRWPAVCLVPCPCVSATAARCASCQEEERSCWPHTSFVVSACTSFTLTLVYVLSSLFHKTHPCAWAFITCMHPQQPSFFLLIDITVLIDWAKNTSLLPPNSCLHAEYYHFINVNNLGHKQ